MEIRVPVFAGRRILKKESLWDIRDYTYAGWQLYYADHTDGLLKGCEIHAEDGRLVIGKGMLKFHDFIYLMMEEEYQYHMTEDEMLYLTIHIQKITENQKRLKSL